MFSNKMKILVKKKIWTSIKAVITIYRLTKKKKSFFFRLAKRVNEQKWTLEIVVEIQTALWREIFEFFMHRMDSYFVVGLQAKYEKNKTKTNCCCHHQLFLALWNGNDDKSKAMITMHVNKYVIRTYHNLAN